MGLDLAKRLSELTGADPAEVAFKRHQTRGVVIVIRRGNLPAAPGRFIDALRESGELQ